LVEAEGVKSLSWGQNTRIWLSFAERMSKKAWLGANLPQSSTNLQETGIFRLLLGPVFVL
jgi:hypothetical protein